MSSDFLSHSSTLVSETVPHGIQNSPIQLGCWVREAGGLLFPPPRYWDPRHKPLCPAFLWVLGLELGSSYLISEHFTIQAVFPALPRNLSTPALH